MGAVVGVGKLQATCACFLNTSGERSESLRSLPQPAILSVHAENSTNDVYGQFTTPFTMSLVDHYRNAAERANTRRSYASDIRHFEEEWGGFLPATIDSVALFGRACRIVVIEHAQASSRRLVALACRSGLSGPDQGCQRSTGA